MSRDGLDRRTALRLAGLGAASALAGCLGGGDGEGTPTSTPTGTPAGTPTDTPGGNGTTITARETLRLAVRTAAPEWYHDDEPVGFAAPIDSPSRQRAALDGYDVPEERRAEVDDLLEDVDYGTDRLVLLESVGPDTCHSSLEVSDVRVVDGTLRATSSVVDTSEPDEGCGAAVTFASSLVAVTFDGDPLDEVTVAFTDGWDETGTVTASVEDPLPGGDAGDPAGYVRPDGDPEPVGPLACEEDGVQRHPQSFDEPDLQWGDFAPEDGAATELALRVDETGYAYGDAATLTLTNVTDEEVHTGNRAKYNLQVYTEDGWRDVRVRDEDAHWGYTDEAIAHAPGEGFEWEFDLTESGIVEDAYHDDARVCPDLQSGRYRFAYFGVIGDGAVAASFDLSV